MYYTYILSSEKDSRRYIGFTKNLEQRLSQHNRGKCRYTAKHRPWKVRMYVGFESEDLARAFEKYLKSGSGHAFAKRHF